MIVCNNDSYSAVLCFEVCISKIQSSFFFSNQRFYYILVGQCHITHYGCQESHERCGTDCQSLLCGIYQGKNVMEIKFNEMFMLSNSTCMFSTCSNVSNLRILNYTIFKYHSCHLLNFSFFQYKQAGHAVSFYYSVLVYFTCCSSIHTG